MFNMHCIVLATKAYFGGLARCEAETSGWWEPAELVCGACSDVAGARTCPKHGADFLEYKCRYCCSVHTSLTLYLRKRILMLNTGQTVELDCGVDNVKTYYAVTQ